MSQNEAVQSHDPHPQAKPANRWNNISSDEDQSESEHSERQQKIAEPAEQTQPIIEPADIKQSKDDGKKKEANIVPFDAKKKFRGGDFAHLKTVKGGFKAEKLEKKKFHLDTVRNPFAFAQDDDSESDNQNKEEPEQKVVEEVETSVKQPKKSKKQQEKEELDALLKELNAGKEPKQEGQKKKKKKKVKKEQVEVKQEQKPVEQLPKPVEEFTVNKQTLEEVMRKKAETAKAAGKKSGKASIATAARRAIEEREAKNKTKKVYVDL